MAIEDSNIIIEVSGGENKDRALVSNICHRALRDSGFSDVSLYDHREESVEPYEADEVVTLLDMVRDNNPKLFSSPIAIQNVGGDDDESEAEDPDVNSEDFAD